MTVFDDGTGSYQCKSDLSSPDGATQHDQACQVFKDPFEYADSNIIQSTKLEDRNSSPLMQRKARRRQE